MDPLQLAAITSGLGAIGALADPYIYTDQEKAADTVKAGQIGAVNSQTAANLAIAQGKLNVQEMAIKYALMGILTLGTLGIAYNLVRD